MGGIEAMGSMSGMDGMGMEGGVAEGEAGGIDTRRLWGGDFDTANAQADGANGMYCEFRGSNLCHPRLACIPRGLAPMTACDCLLGRESQSGLADAERSTTQPPQTLTDLSFRSHCRCRRVPHARLDVW